MLMNEHTAVYTDKIVLVPYSRHHVAVYHDWMKDPDIQAATASEPLTLNEEYSMQQSWRLDPDKLTFILCKAPLESKEPLNHVAEVATMIGDANMFVSTHEEEDGQNSLVGELELMIASKDDQGKGSGRSALLTFLCYVLNHEEDIVKTFYGQQVTDPKASRFDYLAVKINEQNGRSLSLFEKVGFKKVSAVPNFFGEFELRYYGLSLSSINGMLSKHQITGYREASYHSCSDGSS